MKQITATAIDAVIEQLEHFNEDQYEQKMDAFAQAQPVVFSYLFSEQFDLLTEDERGYLHYLSLIIWMTLEEASNGDIPEVSEEQIGDAEERNYELWESSEGTNFRGRLDVFFEDYPQEELLAFAEEAVLEEEEGVEEPLVTKEGREPIFIALKTQIDVMTAQWADNP